MTNPIFAAFRARVWRAASRSGALLFSTLLFCAAVQAQEVAGEVVLVQGLAQVGGQAAQVGQPVRVGQVLETRAEAYLYIKTADGGLFILRPGTEARIETWRVDAAQPASSQIRYELKTGVARVISGAAVKAARQNFRLNTPVAAIGVRGTDFTVFTDDNHSQVSVLSGGVVVSPFAPGCSPQGLGPCEGQSSLELFAGQGKRLIRVSRGESVPQLIEANGQKNTPDKIAPPGKDEPKVDAAAGLDLLPSKQPDVALTPVEGGGAQPVRAGIVWGRWEPLLGQPAALVPSELQKTGYNLLALRGPYALLRDAATDWRPAQGNIGFSLGSGEAIVQHDISGRRELASVENGQLHVNFANNSFSTRIEVAADSGRQSFYSSGKVLSNGVLEGAGVFTGQANMNLKGVLGTGNNEAAYLFSGRFDQNSSVHGVTHWQR